MSRFQLLSDAQWLLIEDLLPWLVGTAGGDDVSALGDEPFGDGQPDAAAAAGDQRGLAVRCSIEANPFSTVCTTGAASGVGGVSRSSK